MGEDVVRSYHSWVKILMSISLITGTCIGGGMLALPVAGGRIGFIPASVVMMVAWLFMTITGLMYLEISTFMKKDAHISSMASQLLGAKGKVFSWVIYLFICYASLVAYVSEGGKLLNIFLINQLSIQISREVSNLLYLSFFAGLLAFGGKLLSKINTVMLVFMFTCFTGLVYLGSQNFQGTFLIQQNWDSKGIFSLFPLMLTTFSYPGIVPVLYKSHGGNTKEVRTAILIGTTLTLLIYIAWFGVVLGSVPSSEFSKFEDIYQNDHSIAVVLREIVKNPTLGFLGQGFGFLALSTSFVGVGMALFHFLSDGLNIRQNDKASLKLFFLVVTPCYFLVSIMEKAFFFALEISGGMGDALISGLIPACMLWQARYKMDTRRIYQVFGNKLTLTAVIIISILTCCYEISNKLF